MPPPPLSSTLFPYTTLFRSILEDTDGDGKADRFTTFFEGTTATMDIAAHPDGSVYLATRNEVLRLRDTRGDGKDRKSTRLNSSHPSISYAVFCLKKKKKKIK